MPSQLFCTVCDDRFAIGAQVMLYSMRRHVPGFDEADIKVFYDPEISSLSEENRAVMRHVAPRISFEAIDHGDYRNAQVCFEHHRPALLTIEAFRQYDYDQVLFFDADMLCVGDLSPALALGEFYDFVGCEAGELGPTGRWAEKHGPVFGRWGRRKHFGLVGRREHKVNTGLFVVGKRFRTPAVYERLHRTIRRRMTPKHKAVLLDQWVINATLGSMPASLYLLPNEYNLRAFGRFDGEYGERVKILHYSGYHQRPKPWAAEAPVDDPSYDAWRDYAADLAEELEDASGPAPHGVSLRRFRLDVNGAQPPKALGDRRRQAPRIVA